MGYRRKNTSVGERLIRSILSNTNKELSWFVANQLAENELLHEGDIVARVLQRRKVLMFALGDDDVTDLLEQEFPVAVVVSVLGTLAYRTMDIIGKLNPLRDS